MNNYYTLRLNNSYDLGVHYISNNKITLIPDIITKEITDLSTLEDSFMELDNKILENSNTYKVYGSFPVIGIEKNNKIYDLITGSLVVHSDNPKVINGLSYYYKAKVNYKMMQMLLTLLDTVGIERYTSYINNILGYSKALFYGAIPKDKYYQAKLNNIAPDKDYIILKEINNNSIEIFSKEKIFRNTSKEITRNISYRSITEISKLDAMKYITKIVCEDYQKYIDIINEARSNTIAAYHNYINKTKVLQKK